MANATEAGQATLRRANNKKRCQRCNAQSAAMKATLGDGIVVVLCELCVADARALRDRKLGAGDAALRHNTIQPQRATAPPDSLAGAATTKPNKSASMAKRDTIAIVRSVASSAKAQGKCQRCNVEPAARVLKLDNAEKHFCQICAGKVIQTLKK